MSSNQNELGKIEKVELDVEVLNSNGTNVLNLVRYQAGYMVTYLNQSRIDIHQLLINHSEDLESARTNVNLTA